MTIPSISIIVPCFNAAKYIQAAIESILTQFYSNVEIIVIDDGSTDDSARLIQSFGTAVHYFYQPNAGAAAARNTGLRQARGSWIGFLDADDLMMPHTLSIVATTIQATPAARMLWGKMTIQYEENHPVIPFRLDGMAAHLVQLGTMWCKKDVFEQVGWFDAATQPAEDMDWYKRILDAQIPIDKLDHICLTYRRHAHNLTGLSNFTDAKLFLTILKKSMDRKRNQASQNK
jgi:glycosyltransferase involved in cell wall biosynthesis